jgi:hypothetical protein
MNFYFSDPELSVRLGRIHEADRYFLTTSCHLSVFPQLLTRPVHDAGTSLIGVSPEFEIALYTLYYVLGEFGDNGGESGRNPAQLGPYSVTVTCHKYGQVCASIWNNPPSPGAGFFL